MCKDKYHFRTWFNRQFSLSFDGKFKGLSYLWNQSQRLFDLFYRAFSRIVLHRSSHARPLADVISFKVSGHTVKLYAR